MSCNFTLRNDLLPFEQDPDADLESLIARCGDVCNLVYGSGNPDLAGIGVVISYAFQLGLAILFGPIIFADLFFFSVLRKPRRTSSFVTWLGKSHQKCLWSQLLFAIAISLACFVRQTQESCPIYENSMITELAGLNIMSLLLTLSSYYLHIERMVVFAGSIIATYVFTLLAEYILVIHPPEFGRIIQTCIRHAEERKLAWTKDLVGPYYTEKTIPELVAYTCLIFVLTGLWLFLWLRQRRKVKISEKDRSEQGTRAAYCQISEHSKVEWAVGVCLMLMSLTLTGVAVYLLDDIMSGRRGMILNTDGKTAETQWGIGQIGAVFVWAPLLVEMGYNAVTEFESYFKARTRRPRPCMGENGIGWNIVDQVSGQADLTTSTVSEKALLDFDLGSMIFVCCLAPRNVVIVNAWQAPKSHIYKHPVWDNDTVRELMLEGWNNLQQLTINKWVAEIPQRLKEVINTEGQLIGHCDR